jgi:hypothetical protein
MVPDSDMRGLEIEDHKSRITLKGVCGLLVAMAGVLIFIFYVGPWLDQMPMVRPLAEFIDERGIDANMYFYTEVEEFSDANINMENTMDYLPRQPLTEHHR